MDINSLKLTTNTFIDTELLGSYSDVCYEGVTVAGEPLRISLIFEHKSDDPGTAIYDQLGGYIFDNWSEDRRQGRPLTLSIPVLIHHGDKPVTLQTPANIFPNAPAHLLPYVPAFKYDIIDVAAMSIETILALQFWTLRNTLLALKIAGGSVQCSSFQIKARHNGKTHCNALHFNKNTAFIYSSRSFTNFFCTCCPPDSKITTYIPAGKSRRSSRI